MKYLIFTFLLLMLTLQVNGQIFGRIIDKATDKISDQISDRIVEAVSDEITRVAMKPIDRALDDMLKERYVQDSIDGKTRARNYNDFLAAFSVPVDLPEKYTFDMVLKVDTKDYDGEKSKMDMMLTKDGSAIGIIQYEGGAEKSTMVFDMNNDLMAIYTYDGDEKRVMAMPSMLSLAVAMAATPEEDEDAYKVTIEKSGKTKKILGYQTDEWITDEEATTTKSYIAENFPVSWKESFSKFLMEMMPATRRDEMPEGMVLKTETKTKKKNKKSSFEVKKIIDTPFSIVNADYKQTAYDSDVD